MPRFAAPTLLILLAPAAVAAQPAFTHFVTPDGSATSLCAEAEPCSLTRAIELLNYRGLAPGSIVRLAAGNYAQPQLVLSGSGLPGAPIRFVGQNGARLVGVFEKPTMWARTTGSSYTYQAPLSTRGVLTVAQRDSTTWQPWLVDDRAPPYTTSRGRAFTLDAPPLYAWRSNVAQVDAQSCTWTSSAAQGLLYVHMCHDRAPAPADDLRTGPANWGSLIVEGDDLTLENLTIVYTTGTAVRVTPNAERVRLSNIRAIAAQVWLEGVNTLAEDLDVSHVITQGPLGPWCAYDVNPGFGVGECFHERGSGRALLIGREGVNWAFNQTCRRCRASKSWNLARIDGPNVLEQSSFRDAPNHCLEASGTGVVIRDSAAWNCQDSLFIKDNPLAALTVERNVFNNGVYVTTSNDGRGGHAMPAPWVFRYNLIKSLVVDRWTFGAQRSTCNVYAGAGDAFKIIDTNGVRGATYATLAAVQQLGQEGGSTPAPVSSWIVQPTIGFLNPPDVCGQRVGPQ